MEKEKYYIIVEYIKQVIQKSCFEGNCYVVGGAVRDIVMGIEPKDIDICITLENGGIRLGNWLYEQGVLLHKHVVYPTYGTCQFILKEFPDIELEAVQTRKEQYKDKNSRNPETCYGTLEEDIFRRDLTINSLTYNISTSQILDITNKGLDDIKNHVIRTTNDNSDIIFLDDPLRILRVCKFSSRYNWDIEDNTFQSMKRNVDRLSIISQERITDEFNKMILNDNALIAINLIKEIGAMKYVIPEFEKTYGITQNKYHFGDVAQHSLKTLEHIVEVSKNYSDENKLILRISALLHDIGKIKCKTIDEKGNTHFYGHELYSAELCETMLKRMKYPNDFIKKVCKLVKNHMRTKSFGNDCSHMKDKSLRKMWYEMGEDMEMCLDLIHADNLSHSTEYCLPNQVPFIKKQIEDMKDNDIDMSKYILPVNGNDVMEYMDISPSPQVKEYLVWLLKFAFVNPQITKEELLKKLNNFKKKIIN